MRFNLRQLMANMLAVAVETALLRAAAVSEFKYQSLFALLAIWFPMAFASVWLVGVWPWDRWERR